MMRYEMKGRVQARERKDSDEEEHGTPAGEGNKNPESRDLYGDRASFERGRLPGLFTIRERTRMIN